MPRKIRELIAEAQREGFKNIGGKGSHRNFIHPTGVKWTCSGQPGDDAKRYQEKELAVKIAETKR